MAKSIESDGEMSHFQAAVIFSREKGILHRQSGWRFHGTRMCAHIIQFLSYWEIFSPTAS